MTIDRVAILSQQAQRSRQLLRRYLALGDYSTACEHHSDYLDLVAMIQQEVDKDTREINLMMSIFLGFSTLLIMSPFIIYFLTS